MSWKALLQPGEDADIGYLVVQRPFGASALPDGDVAGTSFVSVEVPRLLHSQGSITVGTEVCRACSRPIGQKRLNALPTTKTCTFCQELKEKQELT